MASNYWFYRRNENACWRLGFLQSKHSGHAHASPSRACDVCALGRAWHICHCVPDPWQPLPEIEPDGNDPQVLLLGALSTLADPGPPGLGPRMEDTSLWRHLLRGTHGFSLHGPEPISLYPDAPDVAMAARRRQRNAGWRRWWLVFAKTRQTEQFPPGLPTPLSRGDSYGACLADTWSQQVVPPCPTVFIPVPIHLAVKVQQYAEQLQREELESLSRLVHSCT